MSLLKKSILGIESKTASEKFDVTKEEALEMLSDDNVKVLDIRTLDEIKKVKPIGKDAIIIDYYAGDFKERLKKLPIGDTYLVVWTGGVRSLVACDMMEKLGFKNIYNLKGGLKSFNDYWNQWRYFYYGTWIDIIKRELV